MRILPMASVMAKSTSASTMLLVVITKMALTPQVSMIQPESRLPNMVSSEQDAPQKVCAVAESSGGTRENM